MKKKIERGKGMHGKRPNNSRELWTRVAKTVTIRTRSCRDEGKGRSSVKMKKTKYTLLLNEDATFQ